MNTTTEAKKEATANPLDLTGRVAWEGNCLKIVNKSARERIQRARMSPSTSQSLESGSCATKWAVGYLLPRDESPLEPAPLGTDAHQLLEDLYTLAPSARTEAKFYELLDQLTESKRESADLDEEGLKTWRNSVLNKAWRISAMENPQQVIVYSNEIKLEEVMPAVKTAPKGIPFTGTADRVDVAVDDELGKLVRLILPADRADTYFGTVFGAEQSDGDMLTHLADDLYDALPRDSKELTQYLKELGINLNLIIIDYKTGASKYWKKHHEQIRLYALAFKERTGTLPKSGRVYYTTEGLIHDVGITQKQADTALVTMGASWKRHNRFIDNEEFPTKVTPLCGWCPLVNACPRAKEAGKEPRKAGLPTSEELIIPMFVHDEEAPTEDVTSDAEQPAITTEPQQVPVREGEAWVEPSRPSDQPELHVPVVRVPEPIEKPGQGSEAEQTTEELDVEEVTGQKIFVRRAHNGGMNTQTQPQEMAKAYKEAPQYSTFVPTHDGRTSQDVNPASFAMTAGFSLTTMAMKVLVKQDERITRQRVASLSGTFAHIINIAHDQWIPGQSHLREGEKMGFHSHSRLRGALIAVVDEFPFPLHGDLEQMNMWVAQTIKRVIFTIQSAEDLVKYGSGRNPWELLVETKQED